MEARRLLGQLLLDTGRVTEEQLEKALEAQRDSHEKLGRILVDAGAISTEELLEALSEQLLVALAPAARLRLVRPSRAALAMVPPEVARSHRVLPIFYSEQEKSLTLVTSDPTNRAVFETIKSRNGLNRVRLLLAEESLLDELVPQHYGGTETSPRAAAASPAEGTSRVLVLFEPDDRKARALGTWLDMEGYQVRRARDEESLSESVEANPRSLVATSGEETYRRAAGVLGEEARSRLRLLPGARELLEEGAWSRGMFDFYVKTLDFFLSLLARDRAGPSHRHARQVSQLSRLVADRLGLAPDERDAVVLAGYLYPLGDYLASQGPAAQRVSDKVGPGLVAELWETFDPPVPVPRVLTGMAEPPEDPAGEVLPVAILRAVAEYLHLRDGTGSRPRLGPANALKRLLEGRGERFHPRVVDALQELVAKEQVLDQMEDSASRFDILLVDKDPMALEVLELRLRKEGYRVRRAQTGEEALAEVRRAAPNLVISEITLPRVDGFELCTRIKGTEATSDISFFFLSSRNDGANVTKGLELGADDFLTKPINLDVLVSKVRRLERVLRAARPAAVRPTAVQGSLSELGIFDLIQVLQLGMKTARIEVDRDGQQCVLHIQQGSLVAASLGEATGAEAFYELCTWESGTFAVYPGETTVERNIFETNDFLLMEGMRRADEKRAGV